METMFKENNINYNLDFAVSIIKSGDQNKIDNLKILELPKEYLKYLEAYIFYSKGEGDNAINRFKECLKISKTEYLKEKVFIMLATIYKENLLNNQNSILDEIKILENEVLIKFKHLLI